MHEVRIQSCWSGRHDVSDESQTSTQLEDLDGILLFADASMEMLSNWGYAYLLLLP